MWHRKNCSFVSPVLNNCGSKKLQPSRTEHPWHNSTSPLYPRTLATHVSPTTSTSTPSLRFLVPKCLNQWHLLTLKSTLAPYFPLTIFLIVCCMLYAVCFLFFLMVFPIFPWQLLNFFWEKKRGRREFRWTCNHGKKARTTKNLRDVRKTLYTLW